MVIQFHEQLHELLNVSNASKSKFVVHIRHLQKRRTKRIVSFHFFSYVVCFLWSRSLFCHWWWKETLSVGSGFQIFARTASILYQKSNRNRRCCMHSLLTSWKCPMSRSLASINMYLCHWHWSCILVCGVRSLHVPSSKCNGHLIQTAGGFHFEKFDLFSLTNDCIFLVFHFHQKEISNNKGWIKSDICCEKWNYCESCRWLHTCAFVKWSRTTLCSVRNSFLCSFLWVTKNSHTLLFLKWWRGQRTIRKLSFGATTKCYWE